MDSERKHLEGLLKDRFNFYIVFASIFLLGSLSIKNPDTRAVVLCFGTLVSFLIGLAVLRTHRLVKLMLDNLPNNHPYTKLKKQIVFPPNANNLLIFVPLVITLLFLYLTLQTLCKF